MSILFDVLLIVGGTLLLVGFIVLKIVRAIVRNIE